jgi:hypothetical protein
MSESGTAGELLEQLKALEARTGRIMLRAQFGKTWDVMTPIEQAQVVAYCERIIGKPKSLSLYLLRPNVSLEISNLKVWSVSIDCDSELSAYRIGKWAVSVSALVAILGDSEGYRVRCLGLNPLVWRDALDRYAS